MFVFFFIFCCTCEGIENFVKVYVIICLSMISTKYLCS